MARTISRKQLCLIIGEAILVLAVLFIAARTFMDHASNLVALLRTGDVSGLEAYLEDKGSEGKWILILIQTIETLSIFLPAVPVYLCAGVIYGAAEGTLICCLTNLALNLLMFLLARSMKRGLPQTGFSARKKRLEHLIASAKKPERAIFLMCLVPGVPNGLIPFVATRTRITVGKFLLSVGIGSLLQIAFFVSGGDLLLDKNFRITVPAALLILLLAGIFFLNGKRIMKAVQPAVWKFLGIEEEKEAAEKLDRVQEKQ